MGFKHVLKSALSPNIPLKEMAMWNDSDEGSAPSGKHIKRNKNDTTASNKESTGNNKPFIQINDFNVDSEDIDTLVIDETGFLPKITLVYEDSKGWFSPVQFPNKNPILSLYVKSTHEKMKPIRNDYIITSIKGNETKIIKGELFIPEIYTNVSRSYSNLTSKDCLYQVCEELGLGFQSNETTPNDVMNWINPNWNSEKFIKHVAKHSYQNDQSFFHVFIDKYYHLNYVEANIQLEQDGEFDNTIFAGGQSYNISQKLQAEAEKQVAAVPMGLIENPRITEGINNIKERHLITENGEILVNEGFKKRVYYYDTTLQEEDPMDKLVDFYVKPIESNITKGRKRDLSPINESLKNTESREWINIQYPNTHKNFVAADAINSHNISELNKIKLKTITDGVNYNTTRGMRVPVGIYETDVDQEYSKSWDPTQNEQEPTQTMKGSLYNEFLSGIYYSIGNKHTYEKGGSFKTELLLSKRDWIPNPTK